MTFDDELNAALDERREQSLYRTRGVAQSPAGVEVIRNGKPYLCFCSNDYLGLANHPKLTQAFTHAAQKYGVGSGASHLVCGHSEEHHKLEEELARFTGRPRALLFSTGYMANLGVMSALLKRGDTVLEDRLNHASLIDGGKLTGAQFLRFKHNDIAHLESQLTSAKGQRKLIVVDGVYSMDGDFANLPELAKLANEHNAQLMVDDAHGMGCIGENGQGTLEHFHLGLDDVPILMGTLGKAFGSFGAFVAGSEALIETLIQFARPYIYTTALPPAVAAATRASLAVIQQEPERRMHLAALIQAFREGCAQKHLSILESSTAIQGLVVGDSERAVNISSYLQEQGFWVSAIRPPTVPVGTARLRITLSADHTFDQLSQLLDALEQAYLRYGK